MHYKLIFYFLVGLSSLAFAESPNAVPSASTAKPQPSGEKEIVIEMKGEKDAFAEPSERAAESFCKCAAPTQEVQNLLIEAIKRADIQEIERLQPRMPAQAAQLEECRAELRKEKERYKSDENFSKLVDKKISKICPSILLR